MAWCRQQGEVSENDIKELRNGFGMECALWTTERQASFFRIGVIAHNLFVLFKRFAIGINWQRHRVATIRWRLFHLPRKVVKHTWTLTLKITTEFVELFENIRVTRYLLAQSLAP